MTIKMCKAATDFVKQFAVDDNLIAAIEVKVLTLIGEEHKKVVVNKSLQEGKNAESRRR